MHRAAHDEVLQALIVRACFQSAGLVWMIPASWWVFASRMSERVAGVPIMYFHGGHAPVARFLAQKRLADDRLEDPQT
jgi:hypothetical protein